MSFFDNKLILLEQNHAKRKEKLYCKELVSSYEGIYIDYYKYGRNVVFIYRTCTFCHQLYREYYAIIKHQHGKTQLCLQCTYEILNNKHLNCIYMPEAEEKTNKKPSKLHHSHNDKEEKQINSFIWQQVQDQNNAINGQQQRLTASGGQNQLIQDIINIPDSQLQMNSQGNQQNELNQAIHTQQIQPLNQDKSDPLLDKLQNQHNPSYEHQLLLIKNVKIIASIESQFAKNPPQLKKKPIYNEIYYLIFFCQTILSKALVKTYRVQDLIVKNEVRYLYEYWIKHVKKYLEQKGIELKQFQQRPGQQTKKLMEGDQRILNLNKNNKYRYRGYQKHPTQWNQLVSNLKNKIIDFKDFPNFKALQETIAKQSGSTYEKPIAT